MNKEKLLKSKKLEMKKIKFPILLTIVYIALKLLNIIAWQWIWTVSPLWIYVIILTILLIVFKIFGLDYKTGRKK